MSADRRARSVFINCPFDSTYKPLFDAIVFAVTSCGLAARSALEVSDASELRLAKIIRLVGESRFSIHDISRIELDQPSGFPRFNMPIKLGIAIGAKHLGGEAARDQLMLVLDSEQFRYQRFASDLAGIDIAAHANSIDGVIAAVRNFLVGQTGSILPGAVAIRSSLDRFETVLPLMAQAAGQDVTEITYIDRLQHLNVYLNGTP